MSTCDKHGHEIRTDRYGFASCWECDHEARTCCTRCQAPGRGEARYSYRVYAGRYCDRCWADERHGYRDHATTTVRTVTSTKQSTQTDPGRGPQVRRRHRLAEPADHRRDDHPHTKGPTMKPPPAILLSPTDLTVDYMAPVTAEITGDTADALGVAGIEVECFMPYPSFAEMEVWGGDYAPCDPTSPASPEDCEPPPQPGTTPVGYRVVRAWYDDAGPDMGSVELAAWVAAWERDLASVIHECLLDRACSAAEQRAEMMAGGL